MELYAPKRTQQHATSDLFLVLQILGAVGTLPAVYVELSVDYFLLRRLIGVKSEGEDGPAKVQKLVKHEFLNLNVGSSVAGGSVLYAKKGRARLALKTPVCTEIVNCPYHQAPGLKLWHNSS
mmetsp:Transcript_13519/g.54217  ORF Transcript_13519/g.54217 Transcript_13519/m.54217 type:complete len:122 (-) Transcript_13519:473-838(-)